MDLITYLTTLRFIHIVTGVFWAGAAFYLAWFVLPASKSLGPDGGKFMQQLAKTNNLPMVMTILSALNIISGALLLWKLSAGFQSTWILSKHGIILSAGAAFAVIAFLEGHFVTRPTVLRMNKLGQFIAKQGTPPTNDQVQQLAACRNKIFTATNIIAVLLALAVIGMSLIKYL